VVARLPLSFDTVCEAQRTICPPQINDGSTPDACSGPTKIGTTKSLVFRIRIMPWTVFLLIDLQGLVANDLPQKFETKNIAE
jgi:hypothetical protein